MSSDYEGERKDQRDGPSGTFRPLIHLGVHIPIFTPVNQRLKVVLGERALLKQEVEQAAERPFRLFTT